MAGDMKNPKRASIIDQDVFAAHKGFIDSVGRAHHGANPSAGLRVETQSHAVIRNPLVVARSEKANGVLDDPSVLLATCQQYLAGNLLEGSIASVVIGIGVGIDGQG